MPLSFPNPEDRFSCVEAHMSSLLGVIYHHALNRGSYMSIHGLFNLLNKLGKRDKTRGLPSILSLFHEFNKFNNTRAQMLDSIYHMALRLL